MSERKLELSEEQIGLLYCFSPEYQDRHIQASHTGSLMAVETIFVGTLKIVGKVCLRIAINRHSR